LGTRFISVRRAGAMRAARASHGAVFAGKVLEEYGYVGGMRAVLAVGVLLLLPLSGCFGLTKNDDSQGTGNPADMGPEPVANFTILVDGNLTAAVNGTLSLPAGINITFDATSSTGTDLAFAWDMGDNTTFGTIPEIPMPDEQNSTSGNSTGNQTNGNQTAGNETSPENVLFVPTHFMLQDNETGNATGNETANVTGNATANETALPEFAILVHSFNVTGNLTVTLYVTDAYNRSAMYAVDITVAGGDAVEGAPAPGTFIRKEVKTFTGSFQASYQMSPATTCETVSTRTSHTWTITSAEANGTATQISKIRIQLAGAGTSHTDSDVILYNPAGTKLGEGTGATQNEDFTVEGPLPGGAYKVEVIPCRVVNGTYTVTATAWIEAA
jgi:hypothetical protein